MTVIFPVDYKTAGIITDDVIIFCHLLPVSCTSD
jgi:hypothetical protein